MWRFGRLLPIAARVAIDRPIRRCAWRFQVPLVRQYHDAGSYGYRVPREYGMPDYSPDELANRNENSALLRFVYAHRQHGHKLAELDPLKLQTQGKAPELDPARYGLRDRQKRYNLAGILHVNELKTSQTAKTEADINAITNHLRRAYAGRIAYEFMHIPNSSERRWLAKMAESNLERKLTVDAKKRIFELLTRSEVFDHFMGKKFGQVKRYGLEGAESMMVALDSLFRSANEAGIADVILGMPHRGRLNLLTDLLQYDRTAVFSKIKGNAEFPESLPASGDVLSHLANSPTLHYDQEKPLRVALLHNPSHLEAVNPVAMGKARAKQMYLFDQRTETDCHLGDRVMCLQIHGDAAFAGQGVVMETLGLSNLPHFTSGGSIHVIVNNQIGYTTPATNARSTAYTTDIAKMINAPIIHVNGDHPEEVAWASKMAFEYRNKFRKDVILDLVSFRRWGHNELDEPSFTQPKMYNIIRARKSVPRLYEEKLLNEGIIENQAEIDSFRQIYFDHLDEELKASDTYVPKADHLQGKWRDVVLPTATISKMDTGVEVSMLEAIGKASVEVPRGMSVHPRLEKFHIQGRLSKIASGKNIDWATAEVLAWGSLLLEGYGVRICGQDVGRGTFSQRHAMLVDQETESIVVPLNNLAAKVGARTQGFLEVTNSNLSELAVLGFEYGMSIDTPNVLNIWEAQFGDFFNAAQVTIDTYVASGETKWLRQSGLVMLLPHGFDGAGPEHSSCRMERFLQMADDRFDVTNTSKRVNVNWHVVNPTTPSQYFHLLRRQMKRPFRKPLIVVGPKSLLRLPAAASGLSEMRPGTSFQPVLGDTLIKDSSKVERVILLSGKLYYDLLKERASKDLQDRVALLRLEELCPFPAADVIAEISNFPYAKDFVWCQEEAQNGGAYTFVLPRLEQILPNGAKLRYIGRDPLAAPATGISKRHKAEQAKIFLECFDQTSVT